MATVCTGCGSPDWIVAKPGQSPTATPFVRDHNIQVLHPGPDVPTERFCIACLRAAGLVGAPHEPEAIHG